jgi:hypothetical protein
LKDSWDNTAAVEQRWKKKKRKRVDSASAWLTIFAENREISPQKRMQSRVRPRMIKTSDLYGCGLLWTTQSAP